MNKYYIFLFFVAISFFAACNISAQKMKNSQDIALFRKEVKDQIVKKYDIEKSVQTLVGSSWGLHSDSGYVTKHFTELQKYLKKNKSHSFYGALAFKTDSEVELYARIIMLNEDDDYGDSFTKKYEYIKDKQYPGLLHFLDKETGKEDFSLQTVSPYLMVDTQHSKEAQDQETLFVNVSLFKNPKGNCMTENSLSGKKLVKYDFLEEYFLYKKMKKTDAVSKSEFNTHFSYILKNNGKNLVQKYISGFNDSTKENADSNGDLLSLHCTAAYQVITMTGDGFLKTSIIIEGKPSKLFYENMQYYVGCLGDNKYCYTIHPYGFAVLHTNIKTHPKKHKWENYTKPGIALNFPSTLYVLVD